MVLCRERAEYPLCDSGCGRAVKLPSIGDFIYRLVVEEIFS